MRGLFWQFLEVGINRSLLLSWDAKQVWSPKADMFTEDLDILPTYVWGTFIYSWSFFNSVAYHMYFEANVFKVPR